MEKERVGVVGAGMMGAEIALCFAMAGHETVMSDIRLEAAEKGKDRLGLILEKQVQKGMLSGDEKKDVLKNLQPTGEIADMGRCQLVIEAVSEVLETKLAIFEQLDKVCAQSAVIASNTSSISITKLASALKKDRASRFVGMHFNSPASVMKLVEVVPGLLTSEDTAAFSMEILDRIGKVPVKVKDVTGFALNRMFHVFVIEACRLLEEGVVSAEDLDKVCVHGLGHPIGVLKMLDIIGLDLCMTVDEIMFDAYGERFRPSAYMQRLIDAGQLGRKTGAGFFTYEEQK